MSRNFKRPGVNHGGLLNSQEHGLSSGQPCMAIPERVGGVEGIVIPKQCTHTVPEIFSTYKIRGVVALPPSHGQTFAKKLSALSAVLNVQMIPVTLESEKIHQQKIHFNISICMTVCPVTDRYAHIHSAAYLNHMQT